MAANHALARKIQLSATASNGLATAPNRAHASKDGMKAPRALFTGVARTALMWVSIGTASSSLAACDPGDTPPATAPQNDSTDVPPPAPPPAAMPGSDTQGTSGAGAAGDTQYASGEFAVGENTDAYDDDDPAALTDFHSTLDPYGAWVDDGTYGTVWVPAGAVVGADFSPYGTAGHWVYDDDWVWASDYPWGWAPFHYGRWVLIEGRGWAWIPGRVYRGAWVAWSVDDGYGYLGWAPLGPEFIWFGGRPRIWRGYIGPRWVYCSRTEVFSDRLGARLITGPAAARVSGHMHAFVAASPGVAGPPPARLGYSPAQVPHATGAGAQSVTHAQAFARPSTAVAVGGTPPTRLATPSTPPVGARPVPGVVAEPRGTSISTSRTPAVTQAPGAHTTASPSTVRPSAPAFRPATPAFRPSAPPPSPHSSGGHRH